MKNALRVLALLVISAHSPTTLAGSNEAYAREVEKRLQPVFSPGTRRNDVEAFLRSEGLRFHVTPQDQCEAIRKSQERFGTKPPALVACPGGGYLHVRVPVDKRIRIVESGVHVTFEFGTDDKLVGHKTRVAHTGP